MVGQLNKIDWPNQKLTLRGVERPMCRPTVQLWQHVSSDNSGCKHGTDWLNIRSRGQSLMYTACGCVLNIKHMTFN